MATEVNGQVRIAFEKFQQYFELLFLLKLQTTLQ